MKLQRNEQHYDLIIVGAGASGLMCAIHAGRKGLNTLVLEKGAKPGLKILVSGGGRCNFTNVFADPRTQYLSRNSHFCISAMHRYAPQDFIDLVERSDIAYHEKKLGQLFCDDSAKNIVDMLLAECEQANVNIKLRSEVTSVTPLADGGFAVATTEKATTDKAFTATRVVMAAGGLSMPKIASDIAYRTANNLGMKVIAPRAALVPFTWSNRDRDLYAPLTGIAVPASVSCNGMTFDENILFTHRGLSGPGILQISSFWREGDSVTIDLMPDKDAGAWLNDARNANPQTQLLTTLKRAFPNRLAEILEQHWFRPQKIGSFSPPELTAMGAEINHWQFKPGGTEGYRTAEVTLGGIDTNEVSSKTFESTRVPGLYVIGEALDVTGWLGGYNFQWAWASAYACAEHL